MNLKVSSESITLVKNDQVGESSKKLLPLQKGTKLAVIGPHVNNIYHWLGDYTAPQLNDQYVSFIDALNEFSENVTYSKGSEIREHGHGKRLIHEAVETAKKSDVVVLTLGGSSMRDFDMSFMNNGALSKASIVNNTDTGENVDVASLEIGGNQIELLEELKKIGKPIIAVMIQGRPYDITEVVKLADAVLVAWYPGQQGPQAVSNIIFGITDPTGKLPISYPRNSGQLPVYYYQRRVLKNEDYFDEKGSPLFKFGYGLNYNKFEYKNLKVKHNAGMISASIQIENLSDTFGIDTILLFASSFGTSVLPRYRQLMSFKKIGLNSKESKTLNFEFKDDRLLYVDENMEWKLPKKIKLSVNDCKVFLEL